MNVEKLLDDVGIYIYIYGCIHREGGRGIHCLSLNQSQGLDSCSGGEMSLGMLQLHRGKAVSLHCHLWCRPRM